MDQAVGSRLDDLHELPPSVLYHYTTLTGLLGIVRSGHIWATDLRYLNDITEAQRIKTFIRARLQNHINTRRQYFKFDASKAAELLDKQSSLEAYVASFTEARDDLSQWRAYSRGSGVCIGFCSQALQVRWSAPATSSDQLGMLHGHRLFRVRYVPDDGSSELDDQISEFADRAYMTKGIVPGRETKLVASLGMIATAFKHRAFSQEKEWRISVPRIGSPQVANQQFREGNSMLVPYISLVLNLDIRGQRIMECPIREIVVGPTANMLLARESVSRLLSSNNLCGATVTSSGVPYRDW